MATGFGAGTAAGVLGIGSGMVNGPVLLEMGLLPEVATATSAFMIVSYYYRYIFAKRN
jgi:uncharacterized membrane protein YfcA